MRTIFHIKETAWLNLMPVYMGYNAENEEDYLVFPRYMSRTFHAWWWVWRKLFTHDRLIITGEMKCPVTVIVSEDGDVCGLEL